MPLALAALAALAFTLGGVVMKYADGVRRPLLVAGFVALFAAGAVAQSLALRNVELGTTYILVLGLEATLAFTFGVAFFGESVTISKAIAVLLIVTGIALLRTA